ncbi:unnamed protein product [Triticum turgidum subsp. durum]|uniref:VQ domain-containing protein n=1 Tax=Triticum turgidum subsp. durum TaxID=4567 RepID=A0A9R1RVX8_TRITD|nr:unnamed protein product [Triticum turgidum subsp. durum]
MASTTSGSLPSSPSLPGTGSEQEFFSVDPHGLFLPSSPSPASLFDHDSSFQGFFPTSSPTRATATPPHPTAPSKQTKKRPRASRRPPTTVLTTDTSNFRAMVQEFTGFPAPPFAAGPSPFVRPRLLGGASAYGPPFLVRPCPLKYPQQNPALLSSIGTGTTTGGRANSLMHALALLARSNAMPSTPADVTARGSGAADQYGGHHGHGMGDFNYNPFDDFETETAAAAAEGDKAANGDHAGFFSSLGGAGDKYDRH